MSNIEALGSFPLSPLTLGTSALGNPERVSETIAEATILAALQSPLSVIDTGNNYGISEARIGRALRAAGGLPAGRLLATKADPLEGSADFSGARVRASVQESLDRLGVDHLELVHLHDPERITFAEAMAADGPVRALLALQESGVITYLGVAGGPVRMLENFVRTGHFQALVTHNRFTLLDRSAESLLDLAAHHKIAVFNAAPYGGGFLSGGAAHTTYCYRPATAEQLAARSAMADRCAEFGTDLATAALQFSLREPRISSTIVGVSSPAQLEQTLVRAAVQLPAELWAPLDDLIPDAAGWFGPDRI